MADRFIISDSCPPEQQAIFNAINQALKKTGATADEFDRCFRTELMEYCALTAGTAGERVLVHASDMQDFSSVPDSVSLDVKNAKEKCVKAEQSLGNLGLMQFYFAQSPSRKQSSTSKKVISASEEVKKNTPKLLREMVEGLEKEVGPFYVIDRNQLEEYGKIAYDEIYKTLPNAMISPAEKYEVSNLLQQFADGKPLLKNALSRVEWQVGPVHLRTNALGNYMLVATVSAIKQMGENKGWSKKKLKELAPELESIQTDIKRLIIHHGVEAINVKRLSAEATLALASDKASDVEKIPPKEELLPFTPYDISPKFKDTSMREFESIRTRATRTDSPPDRELIEVWKELQGLLERLNGNFHVHQQLGDAIFRNDNSHLLYVLDHICTGKAMPPPSPNRETTRRMLVNFLSDPIQELAPQFQTPGLREQWIEANREMHQQAVDGFLKTPLLVIAALGTPEMIADARVAYDFMYPRNKSQASPEDMMSMQAEIWQSAAKAIAQAFKEAEKSIPPAFVKAYGIDLASDERLQKAKSKAEAFIREQANIVPPFNMMRCNMVMQPGHEIMLTLSRWLGEGRARRVDSCPPVTLNLNEPDMGRALKMKQRLQDHLFATFPSLNVHRRLHAGFIVGDDEFLTNSPVIDRTHPAPDGLPGRLNERGGIYILRLTFSEEGADGQTNIDLPLGVDKQGDLNEANRRRLLILGRINEAQKQGEHLTRQDLRLWLQNEIEQEANCCLLVLDRISEAQKQGEHLTPQDLYIWLQNEIRQEANPHPLVLDRLRKAQELGDPPTLQELYILLQNEVQKIGGSWQQADSIDLNRQEHENIVRNIPVRFPAREGDELSSFHIGNPWLKGNPNVYWNVPVAIYSRGSVIGNLRVNTHIRDPEMVLARLPEIVAHLKKNLEDYAEKHPQADWKLTETGQLDQLTHDELLKTDAVEWTRFSEMRDALGYTHQLAVHTSPLQDKGEGRLAFTLAIQRADGSSFFEERPGQRQTIPFEREFTLPALADQQNKTVVEHFRSIVNARFTQALEEAYSPGPGKHVKKYDSRSIANMFNDACLNALNQPELRTANIEASSEAVARLVVRHTTRYGNDRSGSGNEIRR